MSRTFKLYRDEDVSKVSGIGWIAEGCRFSDGTVSLRWINTPFPTTATHTSIESVLHIHGHGGKTRIVWDDEGAVADFGEGDIRLLHDILSLPDGPDVTATRSLLSKIRAMMSGHSIPT